MSIWHGEHLGAMGVWSRLKLMAIVVAAVGLAPVAPAVAQDADLAQQLSNPLANLISVPLQFNINEGYVGGDGQQNVLNVQPVLPFSISPNWNVISRTIVPLIDQTGVVPGGGSQSGIGPITQNFFFSPKAPTAGGLIWGVGPVFTTPPLNDDLGRDQWGLGATVVGLRVTGPLTVGFLGNHIWSVTNNDVFGEQSNTFLQPFVSYTLPSATTISLNTESSYNWVTEDWSVPINLAVAQMLNAWGQPIQVTGGVRYWAEAPDNGPEGWGARVVLTYLFPKG
jgi:hypothetical protein